MTPRRLKPLIIHLPILRIFHFYPNLLGTEKHITKQIIPQSQGILSDVYYLFAAEEGSAAEIILLGNVEHPYSLVEYEGVTAAECGELCLKNILFPCRSFLSGRVENQLYCGLTHQNREGLVQNPGSIASSRSLNYYEISRNVEGGSFFIFWPWEESGISFFFSFLCMCISLWC